MNFRRDSIGASRSGSHSVYASFVAFGFFWGAWGASLPALRLYAGVSVSELGVSLAFIGVGALPAMLLAGRAFDRFGPRTGQAALIVLAAAGIGVSTVAQGFASLALLMLATGATSGASDVAINAAASTIEHKAQKPVITRAHAFFSLAVVVSSVGAGGLSSVGAPPQAIFLVVAAVAVMTNLVRTPPEVAVASRADPSTAVYRASITTLGSGVTVALVALGVLGALALAVENAHQSWSAVFLQDSLDASPIVASLGPASFAAVASVIRFSASAGAGKIPPIALLGAGAVTALVGTTLLAASSTIGTALAGVTFAAAGTAVCFPTLLSVAAAHTSQRLRGRVVSAVSSIAYLGFLLGPGTVGLFSAAGGLRVGLLSIAGLSALFVILVVPIVTWATRRLAQTLSD